MNKSTNKAEKTPLPSWAKVGARVIVVQPRTRGPRFASVDTIREIRPSSGMILVGSTGTRFKIGAGAGRAFEYTQGKVLGLSSARFIVPETGPNVTAYAEEIKARDAWVRENEGRRAASAQREAKRESDAARRIDALRSLYATPKLSDDQREALEFSISRIERGDYE